MPPDQPGYDEITDVAPGVRRLSDDVAELFFTEWKGIFIELGPGAVYHVPVLGIDAQGSAGGSVPSCKISTD